MAVVTPLPPVDAASWSRLSDVLSELALSAGALIEEIAAKGFDLTEKDDGSPATTADTSAEALITAGLSEAFPGIQIIGEEAVSRGGPGPVGGVFFLVDPLDGTREFLKRNGNYTVNIALISDHLPVAGVVYAPALGRLFVTTGPDEAVEIAIAAGERCDIAEAIAKGKVLKTAAVPEGTPQRALISQSHADPETLAYLKSKGCASIAVGSSFKFCMIAAGEADLYPRFGPTSAWDTAAGQAILEQAGGSVWDEDGRRLSYARAADTPFGYTLKNPAFIAHASKDAPAFDVHRS